MNELIIWKLAYWYVYDIVILIIFVITKGMILFSLCLYISKCLMLLISQ